jgi:ferredoxin
MEETLQIDRIRCDGHGLCAELLPELVTLDDWGYPIIKGGGAVPASLVDHGRRAVEACPVLALQLARRPSLELAPLPNGRLRPAASAHLQTG